MLPAVAAALQVVLLSVFVAAAVEVPIAWHSRRLVYRRLAESEARVMARLDEALKAQPAGLMRGGHDPVAMAEAKAAKAEEKRLAAIETQVEVKAFLADRFGPERVAQVEAFLGEDTMQGIYEAGKRWRPILAPLLRRMPERKPADAPLPAFTPAAEVY